MRYLKLWYRIKSHVKSITYFVNEAVLAQAMKILFKLPLYFWVDTSHI